MGKRKTRNKLKKIHNIEKSSAKKTKTSIILDQILPIITKKFPYRNKNDSQHNAARKISKFPNISPKKCQ